jgi:hypothetical protein
MEILGMIKTNQATVTTLAGLQKRHLEPLQKYGVTERAIELLAIISVDFVNASEMAPAVFRHNHRPDAPLIRWLEERRFITSSGTSYVPQFYAFCATLAAKKRVAASLYNEMKRVIRRALELLDEDPQRTHVSLEKFALKLPISANTIPAIKLLESASLGIYLSPTSPLNIQFTEETLKGKNLLNFVSSQLDMITHQRPGGFVSSQSPGAELNTFSINNLLLVEEAHKHAERALVQHQSTPDTAISSAKSTLESTLKYIAHAEGVAIANAIKLPELFKLCKPLCGLGSDASHKMGRTIASLCTEIAEARNKLGDSHGKSPGALAPTRSEARFIVGVALHLSECLLERYEATRMTKGAATQ